MLLALSGSSLKLGPLSLAIPPAVPFMLQALGLRLLLQGCVCQHSGAPLQVLLLPLYSAVHLLHILLCTVDGLLYIPSKGWVFSIAFLFEYSPGKVKVTVTHTHTHTRFVDFPYQ